MIRSAAARRRLRGALQALLMIATSVAPASGAVVHAGQLVMGTVLQVTVVAPDEASARAAADAAIAEARRWDDILTTWRPDGELAQLNAHAGGGPVAIGADLSSALQTMQRLTAVTQGAFDPAVGPLVDLWRGPTRPAAPIAPSARHRIASALSLDGHAATLLEGAKLDAGGIGKGMALDAAGALLRARGVEVAYLDFGGSSQLAIGAPPDSPQGWRVAVSGLAPNELHGVLTLRDGALSTSRATGPSQSGPIIDPRSGLPAPTPGITTVRAADATSAEAWSKAVIILGRDGLRAAAANGNDVFLEDADGVVMSDGFSIQPLGDE